MKYLTLIRAIALLHQYQRPLKTVLHEGQELPYIEVSLRDIEVANRLAHQVMGHSLDELAPQTRRLLELVAEMVAQGCERLDMDRGDYRFTRREVREHTGWGPTQVAIHLERLVELEYLLVHHGGRGQQFVYELLSGGEQGGERFLDGLIDVDALGTTATITNLPGAKGDLPGSSRGHSGPIPGGYRGGKIDEKRKSVEELRPAEHKPAGNAHLERPRRYKLARSRSDSQSAAVGGELR